MKTAIEPPISTHPGKLRLGSVDVDCHVLDNGEHVITQRAVAKALTGNESSNLREKLGSTALKPFLNADLVLRGTVEFRIPGTQLRGMGMTASQFIEICQAHVAALGAGALTTDRQRKTAISCAILLSACAKVGLESLIDEVTGYQKVRAADALQLRLKAFIADEFDDWERKFGPSFWKALARLDGIEYQPGVRPWRWGRFIMEYVYGGLGADIADELQRVNPDPKMGKNHHQRLTSFGQEKLKRQIAEVEAIAKVSESKSDFKMRFDHAFRGKALQMSFGSTRLQ